ncbi:MAG: flavin reductase family protein [Thermotoga sp.]|nr:MAG: flavin reductase family protein [Thermotoga sp.]
MTIMGIKMEVKEVKLDLDRWYRILAPRPVVIISTIGLNGISNAAPFSFVMPVSSEPPLIAFASAPQRHTTRNILETRVFVVNVPGYELIEELWKCAEDIPYGVSEIEKSGLTEERASKVKSPGIKECFAHFECELVSAHLMGDHILIVGKVISADIKDVFMRGEEYLITRSNPLMHIGGKAFGLLGKVIKVK